MRWKPKPPPPEPKVGDERQERRFALFPQAMDDGSRVWLEWYVATLVYERFVDYSTMIPEHWCSWKTRRRTAYVKEHCPF